MKKMMLFISFSAILAFSSFSQTTEQIENTEIELIPSESNGPLPYYVIVADTSQLELSGDELREKYDDLSFIDPIWIEKIMVYKDKKAKLLYGKNGDNGVIVITLKKDRLAEFPETIRAKFKPIDKS